MCRLRQRTADNDNNKRKQNVSSMEKTHYWKTSALVTLGILHVALYWFYQPDDAFIYSVYVKNWLAGNGLTFNGELVEGYSSISWTLLSALLAWPGIEPLQAAKILGLASYLGIAALLIHIHRRIAPSAAKNTQLSLLAMFFSFPLLALWAPAAMEGILFALLVLASCYSCFHALNTQQTRDYALAGLLFAALAITRPEGGAFVGAIGVYAVSRALLKRDKPWRGLLTCGLVFLLALGLLLAWRYSMFGAFFPTTVSAKTGNLQEQLSSGSRYLLLFAQDYYYLLLPYGLATILLIRQGGAIAWWSWITFIYVGGYLAFNLLVGGDWMIGFRFLLPVIPLMLSCCALTLLRYPKASVPLALAFTCYSAWLSLQLHEQARTERMATEGDVIMGKHIAQMQLPADSRIAVVDAGAIPYYSGLPTIDMVGLNNQHISRLPGGFMQKWDNDYVLSLQPKVIQLHTYTEPLSGALLPSPDFRGAQLLFYTEEFQRWYELDHTSLIPQLFIRREHPIDLDQGQFAFESSATLDSNNSVLRLQIRKTSAGIWERHADGQHAVSWHVSIVDNAGQAMQHSLIPLRDSLAQGESSELEVVIPSPGSGTYRILACPTLNQIARFPQCNHGFAVDMALRESSEPAQGTLSFSDPRLSFSGWSTPEASHRWSLGQDAEVSFALENPQDLQGRLALQLVSFGLQKLELQLNGISLFSGQANGELNIQLQDVPYQTGRNLLRVLTPDAQAPGANDARVLGVALRSLQID